MIDDNESKLNKDSDSEEKVSLDDLFDEATLKSSSKEEDSKEDATKDSKIEGIKDDDSSDAEEEKKEDVSEEKETKPKDKKESNKAVTLESKTKDNNSKEKAKISQINTTVKPKASSESPKAVNEPYDYTDDLKDFKETLGKLFDAFIKNRKLVIITSVVVLFFAFILYLMFSPKFRVQTITINGNHVLTTEEIIQMIGVDVGDHIYSGVNGNLLDVLRLDYGKTEDIIISKYPYVEDIKIHADFPSKITVDVTERKKIAVIKINDGFATIDSEGIVVELSLSNDDFEKYNPVICGLEVSNVVLGETIIIKNEGDYQKAIIILGAVLAADVNSTFHDDYSFFEGLQEIRIIPSGMIYLTFNLPTGNMLQVKIQSVENINDDMNWLVYNVHENSFEDLPDGALDMTGEEYIYRAY